MVEFGSSLCFNVILFVLLSLKVLFCRLHGGGEGESEVCFVYVDAVAARLSCQELCL